MEDRITGADRRLVASHRLPGKSDARFDRRLVELNAHAAIGGNTDGAAADGRAALGTYHFSGRISKFACRFSTSVVGVARAQATPRLTVRLLVTRQSSCTNGRNIFQRRPLVPPRKVWSWAANPPMLTKSTSAHRRPSADELERQIPILESIVPDVHLFGAIHDAESNVVFPANQVQGVGDRVDVGSALVRRISHGRRQTNRSSAGTTSCRSRRSPWSTGSGCGIARDAVACAAQIGSGNSDFGGLASAGSEG